MQYFDDESSCGLMSDSNSNEHVSLPMSAVNVDVLSLLTFRTDKKSGFGMLTWSNKDVYSGEWQNNKMWGYGCFRFR